MLVTETHMSRSGSLCLVTAGISEGSPVHLASLNLSQPVLVRVQVGCVPSHCRFDTLAVTAFRPVKTPLQATMTAAEDKNGGGAGFRSGVIGGAASAEHRLGVAIEVVDAARGLADLERLALTAGMHVGRNLRNNAGGLRDTAARVFGVGDQAAHVLKLANFRR